MLVEADDACAAEVADPDADDVAAAALVDPDVAREEAAGAGFAESVELAQAVRAATAAMAVTAARKEVRVRMFLWNCPAALTGLSSDYSTWSPARARPVLAAHGDHCSGLDL
ncbi:hypothetical protein ACFQ9X_39600 [Catenulispora yoronensis]